MDIEERRAKINRLKSKYPEFSRIYSWYSICNAIELCNDSKVPDNMDDVLTKLLEKTEIEIKDLMKD